MTQQITGRGHLGESPFKDDFRHGAGDVGGNMTDFCQRGINAPDVEIFNTSLIV